MNALQEIPVSKARFADLTELVIEKLPDDAGGRAIAGRDRTITTLRDLFAHSKTLVGVPTSAYRAYQAFAEYADHERPLRIGAETPTEVAADRRFRSITEGPAADLKTRSLELIRQEFEVPVLA
jgi:hypothetical protein